jgi:spore maturation protein CgeB
MIRKILYIAFQYEYAKKDNGLALNYKAWYKNFINLGYELEALFYEDYSKECLQQKIIDTANNIKPDLIFFILQKEQIEIQTLKMLKEQGFFTVNFFGDDQWRFYNWSSKFATHFSACITTDKFSIDKYREIGQDNVIRSQWASLDSEVSYEKVDYKYEVSFVGGINPYRKWFVRQLLKKDIKVHCFGNGWDNGRVTYKQMEEIFLTTKINLNISNSTNYDIRYLISNLKAFLITARALIKGGKNSSQTKARNFEIPVQGGFQLTDYVPTIEDYFDIGKELICYNNIDEAENLIQYYLKHNNERENIKISGIKKARENHTFKHRIVEYMKELEKLKGGI